MDLYLDVDGVVNALSKNHPNTWEQWRVQIAHPVDGDFSIRWSPDMVERLNGLGLNVLWVTTWQHDAEVWIQNMTGIEASGVLPLDYEHYDRMAKFTAVYQHRYLREGEPFIWIDDVDIPRKAKEVFPEALLIRPTANYGITPGHIREMREFIQQHT